MKKQSIEVKINNIFELDIIAEILSSGFAFRGQANSMWQLNTSLERAMKDFLVPGDGLILLKNREHWMLHDFKKKYEIYAKNPPPIDDDFEWLSIMQHYGAPTRLLDFTHSIYIAFYFATVNTVQEAAVWCVNLRKLRKTVNDKFDIRFKESLLWDSWNKKYISIANKHLRHDKKVDTSIVIPLEPIKANRRLSLQQGLFLVPLNSKMSFMDNLTSTFKDLNEEYTQIPIKDLNLIVDDIYLIKICIPQSLNTAICKKLLNMNITAETLWGGLEGLANSLIQKNIKTRFIKDYI